MANSEDEFEPSTKRFKADKTLVCLSAVTSHEMTLTTKPLTGIYKLQKQPILTAPGAKHALKCTVSGCEYSCKRPDSLKYHMKRFHDTDTSTKGARFSCPVGSCARTFFHANKLIHHLSEHKMEIGKK